MKRFSKILVLAALGLGPTLPTTAATAQAREQTDAVRIVEVVVDGGYRPSRIVVREGERVRLRFVRRDYGPCTEEVVFPELGIRRTLPTNEPVLVDLPLLRAGEYAFRCGMHMIHGTLVVSPA